ncbi:BrnA antitoxin family protein [Corticibacterium sp. UT-5YL-CI-8]|nr:BrnA antitoxin family protein [Tianweitania sp. UT-5YL-CI-8]
MKKTELDAAQKAQLASLAALDDSQIDTNDIPEAPAENWVDARRGLHRPLKQPVTIRLDSDILAWFKEHAEQRGYQTEINKVLRHYVAQQEKRRA